MPDGLGHKSVLRIISGNKGGTIAVSEADIATHTTAIYRQFCMWISQKGAATLGEAKKHRLINENDLVVCFNTGSAEKYLPDMRHSLV